MKLICFKNGKEFVREDPFDLDYLELDVLNDYLKIISHLEGNPNARVEVDLSIPFIPKYNLINCNSIFTQRFQQIINRKQLA